MSAHDTLLAIVEREAGKLDRLSAAAKEEPLGERHMNLLEALARCAKQLRAPIVPPKDDEDLGAPQASDLDVVSK